MADGWQQLMDESPIMNFPQTVCELFFIDVDLLDTVQIPLYRLFYTQFSFVIL